MGGVPTFAAVVFDLDNTLCRHEQDADSIYYGAFAAADVDPFGDPSDLWGALDGPPDPDDQVGYLAAGFDVVADQHDRQVDSRALARGFVETVDYRRMRFLPGAESALERAQQHGAVALLTNGPAERQSKKLDGLGLEGAFDAVVFAGDMRRRKPHRDPFDRVVDELGVEAAESLYVGDSLEYDVAGAQNAGLAAAWVPRGGVSHPGTYRPEYLLGTLHELPPLFDDAK